MALLDCTIAFILAVLCANPILKGGFITVINGTILQLDQEITFLTAQLGRLNFANTLLDLQSQAAKALLDRVQADLNLLLDPLSQFGACPELANLQNQLQEVSNNKVFSAARKVIFDIRRMTNVAVLQNLILEHKKEIRQNLQDMLDEINILCP